MKTFFEEPVIRVERFAAESVMTTGTEQGFDLTSLVTFDKDTDTTAAIKPY